MPTGLFWLIFPLWLYLAWVVLQFVKQIFLVVLHSAMLRRAIVVSYSHRHFSKYQFIENLQRVPWACIDGQY